MQVGISTACLYPMETERALDVLLAQGFRLFEVFFNAECEISPAAVRRMRAVLAAAGARVTSLHPYTAAYEPLMFFSRYERRVREATAQYRRYFAAAAQLGARTVVFHGAHRGMPLSLPFYAACYARLAETARAEGVSLGQENVSRCLCGASANIAGLRALLGKDIRFVLDVKQARRAGEPLDAVLAAMGGQIDAVHLSDCAPGRDCLPPGAGTLNLAALARMLRAGGFDGPALIEVYRENFGAVETLAAAGRAAKAAFSSA